MRKLYLIYAFFLLSVIGLSNGATDKIFCYFGSWAIYRTGAGYFTAGQIDPMLCTHIFFAFIGLNSDGSVKILENLSPLTTLRNFKNQNPNLKVIVSMGGWNEGSTTYSQVVNSNTLRANFVNKIYEFVQQYNLDGFDLDWEYPGKNGGQPSDRTTYIELLKELRSKFGTSLLLTAAVGATIDYHATSYNVREMVKYLDYINLMTYDLHGAWDGVTGQNSPLYPDNISSNKELNIHASVNAWINAGASPQKLIIGLAAYGRSFTLSNSANNYIGARTSTAGFPGPYTSEDGFLSYMEICEKVKFSGWTERWDDQGISPYAFGGDRQWVGYDNIRSITIKTEYAIGRDVAGVLIWSVESDDHQNLCGDGRFPLLKTINNVLYSTSGPPPPVTNPPVTNPPITNPPVTNPPVTNPPVTNPPVTNPPITNPPITNPPLTNPPATNPPVTNPPVTNPPITNPPTGSEPECTRNGVMRHPTDCRIYYQCTPIPTGGWIKNTYMCHDGLFFDLYYRLCLYPEQVSGC